MSAGVLPCQSLLLHPLLLFSRLRYLFLRFSSLAKKQKQAVKAAAAAKSNKENESRAPTGKSKKAEKKIL